MRLTPLLPRPSSLRNIFRSFAPALAVALSPLALHGASAHLPVTTRMEATVTWAENISRSALPANWIDALRTDARFAASNLTPIVTGLSLISEVDVGYEAVPRFSRNNAATAGAHATLRYKLGLGAYTPVLAVTGGLSRRDAHITGDNAWIAAGAATVSQRFTPSWRASVTGDWSQHYANHATFDTRSHRLLGTVTYDLNSNWQLTYGRGRLWGDVVANASKPVYFAALAGALGPRVQEYYNATAFETTDSYGRGWIAYRVNAVSDFWWLELSPAIGRNTSLPLRYESSYTVNKVGVPYRQDLWTASILHRF